MNKSKLQLKLSPYKTLLPGASHFFKIADTGIGINKPLVGSWGLHGIIATISYDRFQGSSIIGNYKRGVLEVIGFSNQGEERKPEFYLRKDMIIHIPVIYNEKFEFAILTDSSNQYLNRFRITIPVMLNSAQVNNWLLNREIGTIDSCLLLIRYKRSTNTKIIKG